MSDVISIPSLGFARGAIVKKKAGGPNMLVVRGLGDRTAVVVCESDEAGTLRLRDLATDDLRLVLDAETPEQGPEQ